MDASFSVKGHNAKLQRIIGDKIHGQVLKLIMSGLFLLLNPNVDQMWRIILKHFWILDPNKRYTNIETLVTKH